MQKDEMTEVVAKLEKERQAHIDSINNLTLRQLREKNRKNYVPRLRGKEELRDECKYKKTWKGSGSENGYLMPMPIMKPKILDEWTASRV